MILTIDDGWLLGILEGVELGLSEGMELRGVAYSTDGWAENTEVEVENMKS
jgi:hypothetical protein